MSDSGEKIKKCNEEIEELKQKIIEVNENKTKLEIAEANEKMALEEILAKVSNLETEARDIDGQIRSLDLHYEENTRNLQKTLELERKMLDKKRNVEEELEKVRGEAEKLGEFVSTTQTEEHIRDSISRYKSKIKQVEQLNYKIEEVETELGVLRDNLGHQVRQLEMVQSVIKKLRIAYHQRAQLFQRSRHHYFTMVQFQFEVGVLEANFSSVY